MTRALTIIATTFTLVTASPALASGPEVHCTAVAGSDGLVQLDCYGSVMQEVYERLVARSDVYAALAPIAQEWSFSLDWIEEAS